MKKRRKKSARKPLSEKQKQAAQMYFDAYKIGDIATTVGVHRCTIWRWFQRKDFQKELRRIEKDWQNTTWRRMLKEWHQSERYKKEQAAKKTAEERLRRAEKQLESIGTTTSMAEIRKAYEAHSKAFWDLYGPALAAFGWDCSTQLSHSKKRAEKPVKYIVEII